MSGDHSWVETLHPKRQKEFFGLSAEDQKMVMDRSERNRRNALRVLDHNRRGIDGREQWMDGINHLKELLVDYSHFFILAFEGKVKDMEALTDVLIDFEMGEHENTKNTDPAVYDLIQKAYAKYKMHSLDQIDGIGMAAYFQKHPERQPFRGRCPSEQDIAQKKAMRVGVEIKSLRKKFGLSRGDLAKNIGSCEKTIKNLEVGKPVSTHTFLMVQRLLSKRLLLQGAAVNDDQEKKKKITQPR